MAKKVIARMCPASQQDIEPTWGYNGTQSNTDNTSLHTYWSSYTYCPFTNMTIGGVNPEVGDGFYSTANINHPVDPNPGANSFTGIPFSSLDTYIPSPNPGPAGWVYPGTGYVGTPPYTTQPAVGYDANGMPSNPLYPIWTFRIKWEVVTVLSANTNFGVYIDFERDDASCGSTWECVQIGDHPKFGFKCIEISGASGQYDTKQECLTSGNCANLNLDPGLSTGTSFQPLIGSGTQISVPKVVQKNTENTESSEYELNK
tara:strand:- start:2888 stop:3664 length:777 start_codon:yes stop_codon:yes gene_type:complete